MSERRDIELAAAVEGTIASSGRNVIAAIGIDCYQSWRPLTNAVSDARGAVALFRRLGFDQQVTEPLLDSRATGKAIHELVMDDLRTIGPDDSLVLFYAGHGGTRTHRLGSQVVKTGYLIPVDASDRAATWVELDGWLRAVSLLPAKHILVIIDACHSGIALGPIIKWRDTDTWRNTPLSILKARRSRRIITSALDDQVALDSGPMYGHSLFTGCLIEGLTHGLGCDGNRVITGSELGLFLQRRVAGYPKARQTPDFGTFDFDDRGEIVIPLVVERPDEPAALGGSKPQVVGSPDEKSKIVSHSESNPIEISNHSPILEIGRVSVVRTDRREATTCSLAEDETSGVYFSVADRQAARFQEADTVRRTLLLTLLFQEKVVIPDIFFFICPDFVELVKRPDSLLSVGLKQGLVQPAFREAVGSERPFARALNLIEEQNIRGLIGESIRRLLVRCLDERVSIAIADNRYKPITWQKNTSTGYATLLRDCLIREDPVCSTTEGFRKIWDLTAKWRLEWLSEALATSVDLRYCGVRRGEIMKVVGNHLGLAKEKPVDDIGQLLDAESREIGREQKDALYHFLRWINEGYYINQASACGKAPPLIPSYDPLSACITAPEMPVSVTPTTQLELQLEIPSVDYLLKVPGSTILRIRAEQERDGGYFTALRHWHANPSDGEAEEYLRECAMQYALEITKGTRPPRDLNAHVQAKIGTGAVGDTLGWLAGKLPGIGFVASAGWALYKWLPSRRVNTPVVVEAVQPNPSVHKGSIALVLPSAGERNFGPG